MRRRCLILDVGDGRVEGGGNARRPCPEEVCCALRGAGAHAEVGALALRSSQGQDVQQPGRARAKLAELVDHEGHEAPPLSADAGIVLTPLGVLNALDRRARRRRLVGQRGGLL